ncbi:hypothetical protein ACFLIM_24630 [Nonomuraea sp. M3C6]|uniref:Htaa protein n=1 Tax=Nonomuraea marmarensis TaxID=3351344 RepID=A0ABW7AGE6_9ACTN
MAATLLIAMAAAPAGTAQTATSVPGEPNLISRVTTWLAAQVVGWFAEEPKGEMRPSNQKISLPGRDTHPAAWQARPPGKRVKEAAGKRWRFGTVYELEDGRSQAEVSTRPVFYRDSSGAWQPIDTTVGVAEGDRFVHGNDKTGFETRFGDRTDKLAKIALGNRHVTIGVAGESRQITPQVNGSTVTYPGVWDGADLIYTVTASGVTEHIRLTKPPAAGTTFAFTVKTSGGLQTGQNGDVSITFSGCRLAVRQADRRHHPGTGRTAGR